MVRTIICKPVRADVPKYYFEFAGLSTDTKPETDDIATGSLFHEVNTKKVYAYNEEGTAGSRWIEQMTLGD